MDLSSILNFFGFSVYAPEIEALLRQCNASCNMKADLKRYDSINSESLGVSFWFWWKGFYQDQIGEPQGTVEPEDSTEVVLREVRFTPQGLAQAKLPFGLSFPASPQSVIEALGRKPFSKTKNVVGNAVWTYYEGEFELIVIFDCEGNSVECFRIISLVRKERQKIELLNSLKDQKPNILPERIPEIEALIEVAPTDSWQLRMKSGDTQISAEAIAASRQVFEDFVAAVCRATKTRNAKSIYGAIKNSTKAFNKLARQHKGFIETMEREEIIEFFNKVVGLTGFQTDPSFDLTEEYRSW